MLKNKHTHTFLPVFSAQIQMFVQTLWRIWKIKRYEQAHFVTQLLHGFVEGHIFLHSLIISVITEGCYKVIFTWSGKIFGKVLNTNLIWMPGSNVSIENWMGSDTKPSVHSLFSWFQSHKETVEPSCSLWYNTVQMFKPKTCNN